MRVTSSGTYTPTITNEAGIDTITISQAQYMRVGNTVTVSGSFALQSTEMSGDFSFDISLPVASNIGANEDVAGVLKGKDQNTNGGVVYGNISGDTAKMDGNGRQDSSVTFYYTFTYQVI